MTTVNLKRLGQIESSFFELAADRISGEGSVGGVRGRERTLSPGPWMPGSRGAPGWPASRSCRARSAPRRRRCRCLAPPTPARTVLASLSCYWVWVFFICRREAAGAGRFLQSITVRLCQPQLMQGWRYARVAVNVDRSCVACGGACPACVAVCAHEYWWLFMSGSRGAEAPKYETVGIYNTRLPVQRFAASLFGGGG